MGDNFPNGSVGQFKYSLFHLQIIQRVELLANKLFSILRIPKVIYNKQDEKTNDAQF